MCNLGRLTSSKKSGSPSLAPYKEACVSRTQHQDGECTHLHLHRQSRPGRIAESTVLITRMNACLVFN